MKLIFYKYITIYFIVMLLLFFDRFRIVLCCFALHRIAWHRIASHRTAPHRTAPHRIASQYSQLCTSLHSTGESSPLELVTADSHSPAGVVVVGDVRAVKTVACGDMSASGGVSTASNADLVALPSPVTDSVALMSDALQPNKFVRLPSCHARSCADIRSRLSVGACLEPARERPSFSDQSTPRPLMANASVPQRDRTMSEESRVTMSTVEEKSKPARGMRRRGAGGRRLGGSGGR